MSEWISVKDRLPEESGHYLVCYPYWRIGKPVAIEFFSIGLKRFVYAHEKITHWMPLPEPPKEV